MVMLREPVYITADRLSQLLSAMINRLLNRFVLSSTKVLRRNDTFCQLPGNLISHPASPDVSVIYVQLIGGIKENV